MKLNIFLLLIMFFMVRTGNAQIFINTTGGDKYKQGNNNAAAAATTAGPATAANASDSVKIAPKYTDSSPRTSLPSTVRPNKKLAKQYPAHDNSTDNKTATGSGTGNNAAYAGALSDANNNLPPNAEVGKCYARCFVSDLFEFKEEMVVDKPVSYKTQTIPATYKTVFDTVITKAASVRSIEIPAEYETVVEDIMVSPATQKWVKSTADAGCLSANPADCQVMCLQEVPAVYKKVSRKVVKTPAYRQDIPVPAEYKIVSKQVVDQPARQEQIEIPATYKKVIHKNLVRKGGYSEWKEILCGDKLTSSKITSIQRALKANGYDPGPIDDIFGAQTKAALIKYQQDKNLPVGNLNMETLKSLGVE